MPKVITEEELILAAKEARQRAHAPYSKFKVGAALLTQDGRIFTGCNVENATYGLTVCAERVALLKAVSEGVRDFTQVAVVTSTNDLTPPCGACRQFLWEFCGDITVILSNMEGNKGRFQLSSLLPHPFDRKILNQNKA